MNATRFDVRNRNSICLVYSAEYTGSQHAASVGYLTLAPPMWSVTSTKAIPLHFKTPGTRNQNPFPDAPLS